MRKGFSLIESVMVIILVGITAMTFATCLQEGFVAWKSIGNQKSMALAARGSLHRMMREIRRVKSPSDISIFAMGEIVFTDVEDNIVTFSQEGTVLLRNGQILQDNLQEITMTDRGVMFSYLNETGVATASAAEIATVRVKLKVVDDTNRFVIQSSARIRN